MIHLNGVGIAAPQVGAFVRVFMFGFDHNPRYPEEEAIPFTILINPKIEILTNVRKSEWEGCLSVPGIRGLVPRYTKLRYSGFDPKGNPISGMAQDFHARVVQHENDHVDGFLYHRRIKDLRNFGFEDELHKEGYEPTK